MALGAAASSGSGGDNITHFAGIRLRITGEGDLQARFIGLDEVETHNLVEIPLSLTSRTSLLRLGNFVNQQAQLELSMSELDDNFRCNRIIIYARTLWMEVPA
jgi:hypothetical protein